MLFNSLEFVAFFILVYGFYLLLRHRAQNVLLLIASYVFYGWWDWRFLSLIWISTIVDFLVGIALHRSEDPARRRHLLILSVAVNLGLLGCFKYFGFFSESLVDALEPFGIHPDARFIQLVLPVGISFYTFQTMSYTIDIYRRKMAPTRDLMNFALFVAFFPQLVAGPIERARHLLPQVERPRSIDRAMVREGVWLILFGYFKKVVLADNMALFTREVFERPEQATSLMILVGVYAFAFQIYGDFSGYSDIARGLARLMGFDIMRNFAMPYFATNPQDFWRRWHISLSTWLRDYLYIPLGGNRGGVGRTYRNLMWTMLLGGLWHGAAWHFVVWGAFHGGILVLQRALEGPLDWVRMRSARWKTLSKLMSVVFFFHVVCVGWLLFAVQDLGDVPVLLRGLFAPFEMNADMAILSILVFAGPVLLIDYLQERSGDMLVIPSVPWIPRLCVYSTLFAYILLTGVPGGNEFIYFQF